MILYNLDFIKKVKELRQEGCSFRIIGAKLGISRYSAYYFSKIDENLYAKRIEENKDKELDICDIIKTSNNLIDVCNKLNTKFTRTRKRQLETIIKRYNLDISHFGTLKDCVKKNKQIDYFIENSRVESVRVKDKLLKEGLKPYICEKCGNTMWNDEPIPLQLHHINGIHNDNRLENLQLLCPNCHAQTDNYCGKNIKKEKTVSLLLPCKHIKEHTEKEKVEINKDVLIAEFKKTGNFKQTAKHFNVTEKTLQRICKKFDLPQSSIEFRQMIIEMYGKQNWTIIKSTTEEATKRLRKKVLCFDLDNNFIKEYACARDAAKDGFIPTIITRVCKGKLKTHKKHIFKYKE